MVITLQGRARQDFRLTFRKNLHQKTHRQMKLTEKQKQEVNKCDDYMVMRGKYNENVNGTKLGEKVKKGGFLFFSHY